MGEERSGSLRWGVWNGGGGSVSKTVMADAALSIESKAIYAFLRCHMLRGGDFAWRLSNKEVCGELGICYPRFLKHRRFLEERGYLAVYPVCSESGGMACNVYITPRYPVPGGVGGETVAMSDETLFWGEADIPSARDVQDAIGFGLITYEAVGFGGLEFRVGSMGTGILTAMDAASARNVSAEAAALEFCGTMQDYVGTGEAGYVDEVAFYAAWIRKKLADARRGTPSRPDVPGVL